MKKTPLLNTALSALIASLGRGELLVIAEAGMAAPAGVPRIDLALTCGVPSFLQTLTAVLEEMQIESLVLAEETSWASPQIQSGVQALLPDSVLRTVSQEDFNEMARAARGVVRTGECTPYANVILMSGLTY